MKKLDRFFEVYNEEKQKNKKIFNFPYILCILYIFSVCWKNYKQKK